MDIEQANEITEALINRFIQKIESEILHVNDFNLDLSNGCDILNMVLTLSNDEYDFTRILDRVNQEALNDLFVSKFSN